MVAQQEIHVAHVVYSFATGGLENGVVNIINQLPRGRYQHSIICVSDHDDAFFKRIKSGNAQIYNLNKPSGKSVKWLFNCWKLLRKLKPDVVHTRNLSALEAQVSAFCARVPLRIHGEHGWDVRDLAGANKKYQQLRKLFRPFVHQYIGLSKEACIYLREKIHVLPEKVNHICNGVDVNKFSPGQSDLDRPEHFSGDDKIVFGTVGRLAEVKNQGYLVEAFIALWQQYPEYQNRLKLIIVGDGVLMPQLQQIVHEANALESVWFTGLRSDVSEIMKLMDVFVLPSLAEGISNTLLEAMATGLPVIATHVGGNPELIVPKHQSTHLVEVNDVKSLTKAMSQYVAQQEKLANDSTLVRHYCQDKFSIEQMVEKYHQLYQQVLNKES
ncbi:TIGR03088 family PEP-CTERM/XrtA system glycosyltransferase [Thalassotalea atypica]|uniref:TIGR03088 family PEP-CTERM/XrtA system glycosyltransferase n=1 Tax=Thalassotalea atypica TaxID=2054316 RepID=UPI002573BE84|nr:TIGR03088 family PEP-CTERM/XrtA system glycosyltransferase [Thalassotalea atypica]